MHTAATFFLAALLWLSGCAESARNEMASGTSSGTSNGTGNGTSNSASNGTAGNAPGNAPGNATNNKRDPCVVTGVSDGDSMRCAVQGRVRLLLLDAPEMSQAPFGAQSRDALRRLMNRGDTVWLEYDIQREDQYGRILAHVWTSPIGGTHVNLAQAAGGWAVAVIFQPNVRYIEVIRRAVATARQEHRGLWADGTYSCTPIDHKRGSC